ncbi:hypothetical protein CYMTET_15858 [Cymbomonas tetramitiformis]|uniref:Reverse transcriptase domain-containing protein n=1 Tax=Cymbomonas tetramitiformis TaxID=36881 RepID=A0AAE0GDI4_9CHLO|nr:hypothetical protein CYMTET_15858 [Cymbomonas tetramitiformis]
MEGAAGQAADLAVTDSVNNERRVDGGRSAGQSVGPAMAALPVGTLVEVYWPGERSWYGGRLGGGASVEGATVIEYLDGNPEREEVFLEDRPRGPGDHDGFLSRRGGGRRVGVKTVGGWSREAEKGLLMGWRRLPRGDAGAGAGGETEGVSGEDGAGVDGLAGGMAVSSGEGVEGPHLSLRLELSGRSAGVSVDLGSGAVAVGQSGGEEAVGVAGEGVHGVRLGTRTVGAERGADVAGEGGAVEPLRPLGGASGGTSGSAQLEGSGGRKGAGQRVGNVVCSVPGCSVGALGSRRALTEHFRRSHPDASGLLLSAARLTRCPEQSCGHILSETGLRQHQGNPQAAGRAQGQHGGESLVGDPDGLGEAGWTWLRGLSVDECAVSNFPSLMVPKKLWGLFTECVMVALRRMRVDTEDVEAYKLFFLLPRLVLQPVQQGVKQGVAQVIKERCARFLRGEWEELHAEVPGDRRAVAEADEERVLRDTVRLVKAGQLGKAAKRLELAKLAPATEETLLKLERLHPAGTGRRQDVGEDRRRELRGQALELDEKTFDDVMRNRRGPRDRAALSGAGSICAMLVALLKDDLGVNVRPIACGEVLRKLVAKVICRQRAKALRARFCGRRQDDDHGGLRAAQIGVAVKGGADLGVHTVQAALDRHPEWVCVKADARNAFNAVHREAMFEAIERDFPELWAWTDLCYGVDANLGFRLGGVDGSVMRFVKSKEGTQQGDPLGPLYLAAPLQVVLERVQEGHPSVVIFAYLDDAFFLGPPVEAALAYETYMEEAVAIGLDVHPVKSAAFSPEGDATCFEAGMPGARGELDFIDVLGVPVGKAEAVNVEMLKKVEELCGILPLLNKLGHAQAQGILLRFCAHPRLGFWLRGVPPEMMREAAEEHDRRMQGALRDLLPGGGLAWYSCEFATLPHGMGLTKAARVSSAAWLGGFAQVWEDMRELFPTVTAGTEDLRAESDLPYVNSLQAAMQKVSEAMEVIGEARGANEHLPPQVPKADDVKKLSDYSRSQKRAQRVYAAVLHSADWLWLAGHVGASRLPWLFSVTFNSIGPAFLRGVPCCPALELSLAEYRVALRHILHAEQPLLGQVEECPDCGGERDPTGTHLLACQGGVGVGGGNWYSFIHHKLQRVLFEVAKSAYPLASALHDDFAGYLTYSRNHCPDVTVLDAEGPGRHVLLDVATARPMSDAHLGAAMMPPRAAAKKVEESKVATYGDVRPHHFIPFGVEVYGGLGPAAYGFLRKTQWRFRERRYMEANAEGEEQVHGNGDEDEEAARGGAVGWKEKWVRLLSFALARGVVGLIIRRAVGRCPAGSGWRWASGGRVGGGMGPDLDRGEADRREGAERLALMDRAWEDAFEETDYATQDGSGGGTQESEGTQRERSGQAPGEAGEAGAMASRLLESMEDVRREVEHLGTVGGQGGGTAEARSGGARAGIGGLSQAASSVEDILNEWDDLLSPGPESGVWTQEQSGASPEQAMALAEGGVATLMGASRRVAGLLGGVDGMGGTDEDDGGDVGRSAGGDDTRRAPQSPGAHPGSDDHLQQVARQHTASHQLPRPPGEVAGRAGTNITAQVWSALLKFAATSQGNRRKGSSHGELVLGVEGYKRKSMADAQVWMRATQFIILSPLGQRLGILAVAWVGKLSWDQAVGGSGVMWGVGLVVEGWLDWRSLGGRDEPASGTRWQCAGSADAEGLGWLSEA